MDLPPDCEQVHAIFEGEYITSGKASTKAGGLLRRVAYSHVLRILIAAKLSHTMRGTFPRPAHQPAKTRSSIRSKRAASCSLNSSSRTTDRSRNPALGWVNRTFGRKFLLHDNGSAPSVTQHKIRRRASVRRFWKEPPEFASGVTRTYRPRVRCQIHIQSSVRACGTLRSNGRTTVDTRAPCGK